MLQMLFPNRSVLYGGERTTGEQLQPTTGQVQQPERKTWHEEEALWCVVHLCFSVCHSVMQINSV